MLFPAIQILYVHPLAGLEVDWTKYELLTDVVPPQDKSTIGIRDIDYDCNSKYILSNTGYPRLILTNARNSITICTCTFSSTS